MRSPDDTDATHVDAQARGGGSSLKITVCDSERHARRARARGFYSGFPTGTGQRLRTTPGGRAQNNK